MWLRALVALLGLSLQSGSFAQPTNTAESQGVAGVLQQLFARAGELVLSSQDMLKGLDRIQREVSATFSVGVCPHACL